MKREREILCASAKYSITVAEEKAFQKGARWADATMIERACEWLKKHTYQDCLGVSPIARLKVGFSSVEELVDVFIKAMED